MPTQREETSGGLTLEPVKKLFGVFPSTAFEGDTSPLVLARFQKNKNTEAGVGDLIRTFCLYWQQNFNISIEELLLSESFYDGPDMEITCLGMFLNYETPSSQTQTAREERAAVFFEHGLPDVFLDGNELSFCIPSMLNDDLISFNPALFAEYVKSMVAGWSFLKVHFHFIYVLLGVTEHTEKGREIMKAALISSEQLGWLNEHLFQKLPLQISSRQPSGSL